MKYHEDIAGKCRTATLGARPRSERLVTLLAIAAMLGLFLVVSKPWPVLSQGVALVRVDLAVVAKGYRASKLIGSNVTNDKNETIGKVDELIIDHDKKTVAFAILQVGGFLGMGAHLVAVSYENLQIDETGKKIVLPGASKDELKKLQEYKYPTT
jgi:sporulation protein YlmC with PRC-barrel domain